jgi:DNA polymerase (family X)
MTSEEILDTLDITAKLMDLHNENPFKSKAYGAAAYKLSKLRYNFDGRSREEIESIEGIGKSISSKLFEIMNTGSTSELKGLLEKTPQGVIEMLGVKGLGPKKVRQLWQELNIESVGELLYACNENRLITLKGFGEKTQAAVKQSIEFRLSNQNKFHYAALDRQVEKLVMNIREKHKALLVEPVGQFARKNEVIDKLEILVSGELEMDFKEAELFIPLPVNYIICEPAEFSYKRVELSSTAEHLEKIGFGSLKEKKYKSEEEIYSALGLQFIEPELREGLEEARLAAEKKIPALITMSDLKGILHNHTTYSDGVNSLKEMADHCRELGYEYFGVCDHSRSAFYAHGLSIEKIQEQQAEIDKLNSQYKDFKILKGIESDILGDGSLDYPDEVLKTFDFVVASIHSNLKMTEEKATARVIRAVENPYTSILGHPSGRLLLARKGYPLDYRKVIDACAANNVSIELNAHPYRLDIDWRWIPYCVEKGVKISINPDAHYLEGFQDMYYGVCAARKGMLDRNNCLNALGLADLLKEFSK